MVWGEIWATIPFQLMKGQRNLTPAEKSDVVRFPGPADVGAEMHAVAFYRGTVDVAGEVRGDLRNSLAARVGRWSEPLCLFEEQVPEQNVMLTPKDLLSA
jgi:hypothetical protein